MLGSKQVNNPTIMALMRASNQAQRDRMSRAVLQPERLLRPRQPPQAPTPKEAEAPMVAAVDTAKPDDEELRTEAVPLTADEVEWLNAATLRQGHASLSLTLSRLLRWANAEPPEAKKQIFLVIRCRRCSAGARGGVKTSHDIELPAEQWQWLMNVRKRCSHASIAKTVRIVVDFYMPLCQADLAFEQKVLRVGCEPKSERHSNAAVSVDPLRAPRAIRRPIDFSRTSFAEKENAAPVDATKRRCDLSVLQLQTMVPSTMEQLEQRERMNSEADAGQASSSDAASHKSELNETHGFFADASSAEEVTWEESLGDALKGADHLIDEKDVLVLQGA